MRTAVFSDIHGNIFALEAMLRQLEHRGVEQFIFCGDLMGYFPWQEAVVGHLRELANLYAVLGNHDSYYLQTSDGSPQRLAYAQRYGSSYTNGLDNAAKAYLRSLPQAIELQQEGKRILIVHGSVERHLEGRVYANTKVQAAAYGRYDLVIAGHTHYRMVRKVGHTLLLNPGSLGQPRDGKGYGYCLMDSEKEKFLFQTVRIDNEQLLKKLAFEEENPCLMAYLKSKM